MLNIELISLFSFKDKNLKQLALEYEKRLKPFARLEIREMKPSSFSESKDAQLKAQSQDEEKLLKYLDSLKTKDIFLLSEEGKLRDSIALTKFLYQRDGEKIVLVLASSLGFSLAFKKKYSLLSLSPLTFPHQLAKVVLLEQIYRSVCIYNKKNYHY